MFCDDEVTEHGSVRDFYVSGLAGIEDVGGGNLRFTFFVMQRSRIYKDKRVEKVLSEIALIMPAAQAGGCAEVTLLAAAGVQGVIHGVPVDRRDNDNGNGNLN